MKLSNCRVRPSPSRSCASRLSGRSSCSCVWHRTHPVIVQQQPLSDGHGRSSQIGLGTDEDRVFGRRRSCRNRLSPTRRRRAVGSVPCDRPYPSLPTTRPVAPTRSRACCRNAIPVCRAWAGVSRNFCVRSIRPGTENPPRRPWQHFPASSTHRSVTPSKQGP
jgi:hypothetical protein